MTRIILDCDPGHDDAVAILLAAGHPGIDIAAITTVGGNQTLEKVTRNALGVATLAGITAPIAAGCGEPLVRGLLTSAEIHGETGLDGVSLPEPAMELDSRHGVDLIIETIMESEPGAITLVPTGPLTNIAMAMRREPQIVDRVAEVSFMGGGINIGNFSPMAEFNMFVDPEAAHMVVTAPWKVTMVGLDVTHDAQATPDVIRRFQELGTPIGQFIVDLMAFFTESNESQQRFAAPPIHDPVALARVIDPSLTTCITTPLVVETEGEYTTGMTVADRRPWFQHETSTQAAVSLDVDRFWDLVIDAIGRL